MKIFRFLNYFYFISFLWLLSLPALALLSKNESPSVIASINPSQAPQSKAQLIETCAACHGANGVSSNPEWPSLAGQHASYLIKQLHDFKKGKQRYSAVMAPIVAPLTDEDIQYLAAYYAKQSLPKLASPKQYVSKGEQLYRGGDFSKQITACIACHGPQGLGNAQAMFPVLSGQQPLYTIQQLLAFKEGTRQNDLNGMMRDISARMDKEDMEAVAYYVSGLH